LVAEGLDGEDISARVMSVDGNTLSPATQLDIFPQTSTMSGPDTTNQPSVIINQEFSEPIDQSTLTISDYDVNNGVITNLSFTSDTTVELTVEPATGFVGDVEIELPAHTYTDSNGVENDTSADFSFYYDGEAPDPDLSSTEPTITNATSFSANLDFNNEPNGVTGVEASDFWTDNCTVSNVQGSGSNYTYTITPAGEGEVKTKYQENMAQDPAGNVNDESNELLRTVDWTNPDEIISDNNPETIGGGTYTATIDFNENVNGFTMGDITAVNATLSNFQILDDSTYTVDYTPIDNGYLSLSINYNECEDEATNPNNASNILEKTVNMNSPYSNMNSTAPNITNADTVLVNDPFSEPVIGFEESDLIVNNGELIEFTQVDDSTWTMKILPGADGVFSIETPAGVCTSSATGNENIADYWERTSDRTAPQPVISTTEPDPTAAEIIPMYFDFANETDIIGFEASDVTVSGGVLQNFAGSGTAYTADIIPDWPGGLVTVDIASATSQDKAGNQNIAAETFTINSTVNINNENSTGFNIYPNPANSSFTLELNRPVQQVNIYNQSGSLVYQTNHADENHFKINIEVRNWPSGIYLIQLIDKTGKQSNGKLMVR